MKLVRHHDQKDRETDGAVHLEIDGCKIWDTRLKKKEDAPFLVLIGSILLERKQSNPISILHKIPDVPLCVRAIQGHTRGKVIAPELTGHVAAPLRCKEFLFHGGCSF